MMTSQTRKAIKEKLYETDRRSQDYQKRACCYSCWHRCISVFLVLDVIAEVIGELLFGFSSEFVNCFDKEIFRIIMIEIFGLALAVDLLWNFISKAETLAVANMECSIVKIKLEALSDDENLSDDEVQQKLGELAQRVTVINQWVKNNTAWF